MKRHGAWVAYKTIVIREVLRFSRIWVQTVLPPSITMALYFVIFGNLIGSRIGPMQGVSYIEYIVPGVILMAVITNAYANSVSSFFGTKYHRNIEEMLISPVPNEVIVLGYVTGGVARGLAVGLAVTLVSLPFAGLHLAHPFIACAVALLTCVLFALGGLINGIYARTFDDISIIPTFILTPLTYLGGVFYSIDLLPRFWQTLSLFNPILYMVNAFRYGLLGLSDVDLWRAFAVTAAFVLVLFTLAVRLLQRGTGIKS